METAVFDKDLDVFIDKNLTFDYHLQQTWARQIKY